MSTPISTEEATEKSWLDNISGAGMYFGAALGIVLFGFLGLLVAAFLAS